MKRIKITPDFEILIPILISEWRKLHGIAGGPPDVLQTREFRGVVSAVKSLQDLFSHAQRKEDYFSNKNQLGAYLLYYWVLHYAQGLSLLGELPFRPRRVLDVCSGLAPFAFASMRHGASDVWAIDQNIQALEIGANIAGRYGYPLSIRKWRGIRENIPVEGLFDLIILGYTQDELFPNIEKRLSFIESLLERLDEKGMLVLVESSWPFANQKLLQLRDELIQKGYKIVAPCINQGACPLRLNPNSACFAQREFEKPFLIKEIQRAADINLSSLKMSYLIVASPKCSLPSIQENVYRVISPGLETVHGKRFELCGHNGKASIGSQLKKHPSHSKAFEYLQRGDAIVLKNPIDRKHSLEVVEETELKIEAAVGKPLHKLIDSDN